MFIDVDFEQVLSQFIDKLSILKSKRLFALVNQVIIFSNEDKEYEILACSYCIIN